MATPRTVRAFDAIAKSTIFRTDGPDIDLPAALIELANAVYDEPADDDSWLYWGENAEFTVVSLLIGAYWALTEWHGGQDSPEYAALSALGDVFTPGMTCPPESDDEPEYWPYRAICDYYAARHSAK